MLSRTVDRPDQITGSMRFDHPGAVRVPKTLRNNLAWVLSANVVFALCQCSTLWFIASFYGSAMLGRYVLALSIASPVFMFANLQLRAVQSTDTENQFCFLEYFTLRALTTAIAMAALGVVTLSLGATIDTIAVLLVIALTKAVEAVIDVFQGLLHHRDRLDLVAINQMIGGLGGTVTLILTACLTRRLLPAIITAGLWQLMTLGFSIWISIRTTPSTGSRSVRAALSDFAGNLFGWRSGGFHTAKLACLGLPLGCTALLISLNSNIPRYFISSYYSASELGVFAILASFIVAGDVIASAIHQTCSLKLARYLKAGDRQAFWRLFRKAALIDGALGVTGLLLAVLCGSSLLQLLFGDDFARHNDALCFIMLAALIAYWGGLAFTTLVAMRATRRILFFQSVSTATTLIFCFALIPSWGLSGAAGAIALGKIPQMIFCMALIVKRVGVWRQDHPVVRSTDYRHDLPVAAAGPTSHSRLLTRSGR